MPGDSRQQGIDISMPHARARRVMYQYPVIGAAYVSSARKPFRTVWARSIAAHIGSQQIRNLVDNVGQ